MYLMQMKVLYTIQGNAWSSSDTAHSIGLFCVNALFVHLIMNRSNYSLSTDTERPTTYTSRNKAATLRVKRRVSLSLS